MQIVINFLGLAWGSGENGYVGLSYPLDDLLHLPEFTSSSVRRDKYLSILEVKQKNRFMKLPRNY